MRDNEFLDELRSFKTACNAFIEESNHKALSSDELILFAFSLMQERIKSKVLQVTISNSHVSMDNIMADDRSVRAGGNITGSVIQTGDHNVASLTVTELPEAASVDIASVLRELRAALATVGGPEAGKIARALDDADEEAAKNEPDKAEVGGILTRALGYAKKAADFGEHVEKIRPLIVSAAGWIGAAAAYGPLLALVGLSAG